jgi:hypothetical protein
MDESGADGPRGKITPRQKQVLFLALTFIVIVIIAMICPDLFTAFAVIAVLLGFGVAYVSAGRSEDAAEGFFTGPPGKPPPYPITAEPPPDSQPTLNAPGAYPGAIDGVDDHDSDAGYGHLDREEGENAEMPYGNIYNRNRVSTPQAAEACLDDEANDAEMDGDELMTFQGRARNDAERVTAGTMNRRKWMKPYLDEELDQSEAQYWWGRSEV